MICLCGKPHWVNYDTLYPLPEGRGDYFADDIQRPFTSALYTVSPSAARHSPAPHALADIAFVMTDRLTIHKAAFAGVAFFCHY
jgi:hypothetical protein